MAKRNPFLLPKGKPQSTKLHKSAGILDDHAVRKNLATKEGTIEQTPTEDNHLVNKKYVDDNDLWIEGAGGDIYYLDGRVGIGIEPIAPFHVKTDSSSGMVFETTQVNGDALITLKNDVQYWLIGNYGSLNDDLRIRHLSGIVWKNALIIDTNGNISAPQQTKT